MHAKHRHQTRRLRPPRRDHPRGCRRCRRRRLSLATAPLARRLIACPRGTNRPSLAQTTAPLRRRRRLFKENPPWNRDRCGNNLCKPPARPASAEEMASLRTRCRASATATSWSCIAAMKTGLLKPCFSSILFHKCWPRLSSAGEDTGPPSAAAPGSLKAGSALGSPTAAPGSPTALSEEPSAAAAEAAAPLVASAAPPMAAAALPLGAAATPLAAAAAPLATDDGAGLREPPFKTLGTAEPEAPAGNMRGGTFVASMTLNCSSADGRASSVARRAAVCAGTLAFLKVRKW